MATFEEPKTMFKLSNSLFAYLVKFFSMSLIQKPINIASCRSSILTYVRNFFMLIKTFIIPILSFKNHDLGFSFKIMSKQEVVLNEA